MELIFRVLAVLALISINAFFVAAEFAVVAVRRTRVEQLVQEGDLPAIAVQRLQQDIARLLSTTQIGITLSSLALGWISERAVAEIIMVGLARWPLLMPENRWAAHTIAMPTVFFAIAYLQIVLGELCPKTIALIYAEKLARVLGPISLTIAQLFSPLVWILHQSNQLLLRFLRVPVSGFSMVHPVTAKELQLMLETPTEAGDLHEDERDLLRSVFESGEIFVEEVMTPRTDIHAISSQATLQEFWQEVAETGHNYYPVIDESLDQVRGIIQAKEVIKALAFPPRSGTESIQPWLQTAWFVPEGTPILEVLQQMQKYQLELMMVRELEFDGTAGLVTLNDLFKRMIGLDDEVITAPDSPILEKDNHTYLVQAQTDLEFVNEQLGLDFPVVDDYQTLGGFLLYYAQKIPQEGEIFVYGQLELSVVAMLGPRLEQILIRRLVLPPDAVNLEVKGLSDASSSEQVL